MNSPGPPDAMGIDRNHPEIDLQTEQYWELERHGFWIKPKGHHRRKEEEWRWRMEREMAEVQQ